MDKKSAGVGLFLVGSGFALLIVLFSSMSMGNAAPSRDHFPEVKGLTEQEAVAHLNREAPDAKVQVMRPGQMWTRDFVSNRLRVGIDEDGKVNNEPRFG